MKKLFAKLLAVFLSALMLAGTAALPNGSTPMKAAAAAAAAMPDVAPQTDANNLIGKSVAGYQMWFSSVRHNWSNWSSTSLSMDIWPYVADYPTSSLWNSKFSNLGSGQPAQLFWSDDPAVIDTHFSWMKQYGIDGAAIQRFYSNSNANKDPKADFMKYAIQSAEKYDRIFYIMYDMSGTGSKSLSTVTNTVESDFVNNVEGNGLVSSPMYAHAGGKPVVCIWGLADNDTNYPGAAVALSLVTWFKDRGYYVIIGTPENNFTANTGDYQQAYGNADMISPWNVGRYRANSVQNSLTATLKRDRAWCDAKGIAYQPVIFAGFSWANMSGHARIFNDYPRAEGSFLWTQAKICANFKTADGAPSPCSTVYFAMFDEYDEGTALMKAASDWWDTPDPNLGHPVYFQTYAADGYWLSEDFYLREAGDITQMLKDVASGALAVADVPVNVPTPQSTGPLYYRNNFEGVWLDQDIVLNGTATGAKERVLVPLDPMNQGLPNPMDCSYGDNTLNNGTNDLSNFSTADKRSNLEKSTWPVDIPPDTYYALLNDTTADGSGSGPVKTGVFSYCFTGNVSAEKAASPLNATAEIAPAKIDIVPNMTLTYQQDATDDLGRNAYMDLLIDLHDGYRPVLYSQLIGANPSDTGGNAPNAVGAWNSVTVRVSNELAGATIIGIAVGYGTQETGAFTSYFDQVQIQTDPKVNNNDIPIIYQRPVPEEPQFELGDVNGDGNIDTIDARLILQSIVGKIDLSDIGETASLAADVNADDKIDTVDARLVLQLIVGKITAFP